MLQESVGLDEKDTEKLVDMLITTREYIMKEIEQLVLICHLSNQKFLRSSLYIICTQRINCIVVRGNCWKFVLLYQQVLQNHSILTEIPIS